MKKSRLLGAVICLLACNANASVIYTYTGKNFNSFTGSTFDDSMNVTGYIELAELLAPNLVDVNVTPLSYSFTDGVSTIEKDDGIGGSDTFRFYTNAGGTISMWNVGLLNATPNPAQLGDTASLIGTRHEQTFFASETLDFGQLATCIKLRSNNSCEVNSVDRGKRYDAPGVWAVSAVPIPPALWLFGSGLLGLIGITRRKKEV